MVEISVQGVKYLLLINGGACVALLAYIGNSENPPATSANLQPSMLFFIIGVLLCGGLIGLTYLTQFRLLNELRDGEDTLEHMASLRLGAVLYVLSIAAFALGAWQAVRVF